MSNGIGDDNSILKTRQKRFIEKFKLKLFELFFTSSQQAKAKSTLTIGSQSSSVPPNHPQSPPPGNRRYSNSSLISNYYYGYITNNLRDLNDNKKPTLKSISRATSLNSESVSSENVQVQDLNDSAIISSSTVAACADEQPKINPFLNKNLTHLLSFESFSNFSRIKNHFESSLSTSEDDNNFFDAEFMTNYISYVLLNNLSESSYLKENKLDLKSNSLVNEVESFNLLKQIARDIFLQSEYEPCGLKGCAISVYLELDDNAAVSEEALLTQFRFDSTSFLTTFKLDVILRSELRIEKSPVSPDLMDVDNQQTFQSVVATTTDTFVSKSIKSLLSFNKNSECKSQKKANVSTSLPLASSAVVLSPQFYVKKFKLY